MTTHESEYLTVAEAARELRVSAATVWRWVDSGRLPADRVGARSIRIRRRDLWRAVERREPRGARRPEVELTPDEIIERYSIQWGDPSIPEAELVASLRELHARQRAENGGKPLPSSVHAIREAREERMKDL